MSDVRDVRSEWDEGGETPPHDLLPIDDTELLDALRLAEALERVHSGRPAGIDPREDPALAALVRTALRVEAELGGVARDHAFHSFRLRSRAAVLHALEPAPAQPLPAKIVPFYRRRTSLLGAFGAAAAAAAIALVAIGGGALPGSGGGGAVATNLTPRSTADEIGRLTSALADIQARAQSGEPVPAPLLHAISEGTARVANLIEQHPGQVSKETVTMYIQAAQAGQSVLNGVTVEDDAHGALAAAQRAARDGAVVAARFLSAGAAATAAPTPTATATPDAATPAERPAEPDDIVR